MPNGLFNLKQQLVGIQQGAWTGQKTPAVNYLVVAGGGGGGCNAGGGGGAGGVLQGNIPVALGTSITVTVGNGGAGGTSGTGVGSNGSNSVFGSITALGGGGAGSNQIGSGSPGSSGGSGGGGGMYTTQAQPGGQGTFVQGNAGGSGDGRSAGANDAGGGGGGAGTVGLSSPTSGTSIGGNGGAGIASDISGTRTAYAGGGGAGAWVNTPGTGGAGGGGSGSNTGGGAGTAGTTNTGGGGGGGGSGSGAGAAGGSGIVILSYPDTYAAATSTTGSPTVSTSGSGSISFNGSTQAFSYAGQTPFVFSTGDFTIEFWVYMNALTGFPNFIDMRDTSNTGNGPVLYYNTGVGLEYYSNGATRISGGALSTGQWYHIALARSGTSTKLFVNGTQVGSTYTDSTNYACAATAPRIGVNGAGNSGWLNGYMSNLRMVKGTAVYTTAFTPSTTPLTAITNTSLLLNSVSGAYLADGSTNAYTATVINTVPVWNSSSPFSTGLGYKNRVYTWTSSGSITF